MINFTEANAPARKIAIYYSEKLNDGLAYELFENGVDISSEEQATDLVRFFWKMADEAVQEQENNTGLATEYDLEFWMEKLMNIVIGYFSRQGYKEVWVRESNRINS